MITKAFKSLLGDKRDRTFRKVKSVVDKVNEFDEAMNSLTDEQVRAKTEEFRGRFAEGETLDDLLPEAYAAVKQACRRLQGTTWEAGGNEVTWDMVPYDVQVAGAIYLYRGDIAEMATGEGKTLVAVMPLYLNALAGRGAHLVTVNDYLARRDSEWMGKVYEFLGMSVGCILSDLEPAERRVSYNCDVTYGTNNEFGFDYLRDNMAMQVNRLVQRDHFYAIVDEVDSVLIDEARTPLIISGQVDRSIEEFAQLKPLVSQIVARQSKLVNELVAEAVDLIAGESVDGAKPGEPIYEAGIKLLQARKGYPKHRRLTKELGEVEMQRLVDRVESDFMRDKAIPQLEEELYFVVDERGHSIDLTQTGVEALSPNDPDQYLIPDLVEAFADIERQPELALEEKERLKEKAMVENETKTETIHCLSQLLRAYTLYEKDVEYLVEDNKIAIVDEFTGRKLSGRRWSDGLHQAVEAKEGVTVQKETQTLATITLQNYFRMYDKLAGMTGTADTEAAEFGHTYSMGVDVIQTNRPIHRHDDQDLLFRSQREKFKAIVESVGHIHDQGMPILIGTTTVEASEKISRMLRRAKISHNVLNARQHEREAQIVRDAGQIGAVTIATNMAGRGTDIKLGEGVVRCRSGKFDGEYCAICPFREDNQGSVNEELIPCGLQIVGTERHEARRIDNQLRGRAGRQGDPGYSQFFLSLDDDLLRLFARDWIAKLLGKTFEEGEALEHRLVNRTIASAQKQIEDINFERRKRTLDYDTVMNKQREAIYGYRNLILTSEGSIVDQVLDLTYNAMRDEWEGYSNTSDDMMEQEIAAFLDWIRRSVPMVELDDIDTSLATGDPEGWIEELEKRIGAAYERKIEIFKSRGRQDAAEQGFEEKDGEDAGENMVGTLSRFMILSSIDSNWRDHLLVIDELREAAWLNSYAQRDPLTEFQKNATLQFEDMMYQINKTSFEHVFRATISHRGEPSATSRVSYQKDEADTTIAEKSRQAEGGGAAGPAEPAKKPVTFRRDQAKVGRNDPCPCGSGKKFKKCHGAPGAQ